MSHLFFCCYCFSKLTSNLCQGKSLLSALCPVLGLKDFLKALLGFVQMFYLDTHSMAIAILRGHRPPTLICSFLSCGTATSSRFLCSSDPHFSSHSFSVPRGLVFIIILVFLDPQYNGPLSSDLLGYWWDNSFSMLHPLKRYHKKSMKGALSPSATQSIGVIASKFHCLMKNTAGK